MYKNHYFFFNRFHHWLPTYIYHLSHHQSLIFQFLSRILVVTIVLLKWCYYTILLTHICMSFPALKYSTAFPVVFLSALKYHVLPEQWTSLYRPLWLVSSVVNCLYSFYWDITRDWDLRYILSPFLSE